MRRFGFATLAVFGILAVAGPGALVAALALGSPDEQVAVAPLTDSVRIATDDFGPAGMLHYVQAPAAAAEATEGIDVADPTPSQEVVIDWGNWVVILMEPVVAVIGTVAALFGAMLLNVLRRELPAWVMLILPARRVNELIENAARSALASVAGAAAGKKLTVNVTNNVVRQMLVYMLANAPVIVEKMADSFPALIQKALARLPEFADLPADYTIDKATKAVTRESVASAAKDQGVFDVLKHLGK